MWVALVLVVGGEGRRRRKEVHSHTAEDMAVVSAPEMDVVRPDHCRSINYRCDFRERKRETG